MPELPIVLTAAIAIAGLAMIAVGYWVYGGWSVGSGWG